MKSVIQISDFEGKTFLLFYKQYTFLRSTGMPHLLATHGIVYVVHIFAFVSKYDEIVTHEGLRDRFEKKIIGLHKYLVNVVRQSF